MTAPSFSAGDRVFAKMFGYPAWPGLVLEDVDLAAVKAISPRSRQKRYRVPVFFFGTYEKGNVAPGDLWHFDKESNDKFGKRRFAPVNLKQGLYEIEHFPGNPTRIQNLLKAGTLDADDILEDIRDTARRNKFVREALENDGKKKLAAAMMPPPTKKARRKSAPSTSSSGTSKSHRGGPLSASIANAVVMNGPSSRKREFMPQEDDWDPAVDDYKETFAERQAEKARTEWEEMREDKGAWEEDHAGLLSPSMRLQKLKVEDLTESNGRLQWKNVQLQGKVAELQRKAVDLQKKNLELQGQNSELKGRAELSRLEAEKVVADQEHVDNLEQLVATLRREGEMWKKRWYKATGGGGGGDQRDPPEEN